jgi:hypothetical protein
MKNAATIPYLQVDDLDLSGRAILLEVAYTGLIGPRLRLSPTTDDAHSLQIVFAEDKHRKDLRRWLADGAQPYELNLPRISVGPTVHIAWSAATARCDDKFFVRAGGKNGSFSVSIGPQPHHAYVLAPPPRISRLRPH